MVFIYLKCEIMPSENGQNLSCERDERILFLPIKTHFNAAENYAGYNKVGIMHFSALLLLYLI